MLKVIELDGQGKDADGYIFTLTIGTERYGITDQEVAEMIKAKHANGKAGSKRPPQRKAQATDQPALETPAGDAEPRPALEGAEAASH
jgi:topoisomerase IA-like protein